MELTRLNRLIGCLAMITLMTTACNSATTTTQASQQVAAAVAAVVPAVSAPASPFAKPGFIVEEEGGRLWVLKPDQKKSGKHVAMIGAGPRGMTLRAPDEATGLLYIASRPGFEVEIDKGRLWVLKPGQKKSSKNVAMIGAGPRGMTLQAVDEATAMEYLATKPGFNVEVEGSRIWVLEEGQKKSSKHVALIGAGPRNTTLRTVDRDTAIRYLGSRMGYQVEMEDGRLWVLEPGQKKSSKNVARIGAGPRGVTVKALNENVLNGYLRATY